MVFSFTIITDYTKDSLYEFNSNYTKLKPKWHNTKKCEIYAKWHENQQSTTFEKMQPMFLKNIVISQYVYLFAGSWPNASLKTCIHAGGWGGREIIAGTDDGGLCG